MNYFLMKSEPDSYSIEDLKKDKTTIWTGIRNYRARNVIRDEMKPGDLFLFYYSMSDPLGVAGIGKVITNDEQDITALDKNNEFFDPKATKNSNPWLAPKVSFHKKFKRLVTLDEIKKNPKLKNMVLLKIPRLSVQPVTQSEFNEILKLASKG